MCGYQLKCDCLYELRCILAVLYREFGDPCYESLNIVHVFHRCVYPELSKHQQTIRRFISTTIVLVEPLRSRSGSTLPPIYTPDRSANYV